MTIWQFVIQIIQIITFEAQRMDEIVAFYLQVVVQLAPSPISMLTPSEP